MDFLNTPEKRERRLVHLPMGRFGEAVELAKAALFRKSLSTAWRTEFDGMQWLAMKAATLQCVSLSGIGYGKLIRPSCRAMISKLMEASAPPMLLPLEMRLFRPHQV